MLSCTLKCTDSSLQQLSDSEMSTGVGERAQQLRACTALAEDPSPVPSTGIRKSHPTSKGSAALFWPSHVHIPTHRHLHIYTTIETEYIFKIQKLSMVLRLRNSCLEQLRVKRHWGVARQQSTHWLGLFEVIHSFPSNKT